MPEPTARQLITALSTRVGQAFELSAHLRSGRACESYRIACPAFLDWNRIWFKTAGKPWWRECSCGVAPREAFRPTQRSHKLSLARVAARRRGWPTCRLNALLNVLAEPWPMRSATSASPMSWRRSRSFATAMRQASRSSTHGAGEALEERRARKRDRLRQLGDGP
jgi:hypothetical protein